MPLYAATIFLSAFLLFQVQPIIAKIILPWFGGSSAVWSTCMLFFQLALLLGYLYAHLLYRKLGGRRAAILHILMLAASLAMLPILPSPEWKTVAVQNPSFRILGLLAVTIGLPYFLLSSTSPLLQAWYARSRKSAMPYRLFALSNLASMLALLSYPFLVEPNLTARIQAYTWSVAYVAFAVVCAVVAFRNRSDAAVAAEPHAPASALGWPVRLWWIGYAACASMLLLAVTTYLTQDVAAIPFLWILPLSVYLLSFIFCFDSPRYYRRAIFFPLLAGALGFLLYRLWQYGPKLPALPLIGLLCLCLFIFCMVCHGELVRRRPDASNLTSFYVSVSLGGALGGLFVGLLAPNVFNSNYELPLGLGFCAALVVVPLWKETQRLFGLPRRLAQGGAVVALAGCLVLVGVIIRGAVHPYRMVARNFYSQLRVKDTGDPAIEENAARMLVHGVINHGQQMLREKYRRMPVTYFCPQSGIGRAIKALSSEPRRMGILGLGCGTLAAYGRAGDSIRIYEINPQVIQIAQSQFTYLKDTQAKLELALGDARLVLESEPSQHFDLLVMDAFSGDSVPVHLITREAFQTYFRHLKPGGIVAVNVSNNYLNLSPVMASAAAAFGKTAVLYDYYPDDDDILCFTCSWVLVMDPATLASHPELLSNAQRLKPKPGFRLWTDDFSNLFSILM
ncbi:MAG TPA: fused MFS/spermidine synthase [Bryobacteraceae bacterium]|jgi:SAM-dependent methyltransferase/MFS family permease|nr:fused MFS/spermidine synthase [Bryobacteraceae bacterium]